MAACRKCGGGILPNLTDLGAHITCATEEEFTAWWARTPALAGVALKAQGQAAAVDAAPEDWRDRFRQAVRDLAAEGCPFTSEDVTAQAGLPAGSVGTNRNNAVGALMTSAAGAKVIRKTGRRLPSMRPSSHGAELTEWIGT